MACIEESISEREGKQFEEDIFWKEVEFKMYLHGFRDAGIRLLFKFRSGTHGLNEEVRRNRW